MWELMETGGPVMWPLLVCSVIVLTIIIERSLFWLGVARRRNRPLRDELLLLAQRGEWEQKTTGSPDPVVRVLNVGILHREYDMAKAMEDEAQQIVKKIFASYHRLRAKPGQ